MFRQDKIIDDWNNSSDEYYSKTKFEELFLALEINPYKGFPHAMAEMIKEYYPGIAIFIAY